MSSVFWSTVCTDLVSVVRPRAEPHRAVLFVERKELDVHRARALVDRRRLPVSHARSVVHNDGRSGGSQWTSPVGRMVAFVISVTS